MNNTELVEQFYTAFSEGNFKKMADCYHKEIVFQDPAFGILKGERVLKMWEMLLSRKTKTTKITCEMISTTAEKGKAEWTAAYRYGKNQRKVINHITAKFKFEEGKIIEHIDSFNLWKWTQQALGIVGYLIGWTAFMKNKIQKRTNRQLDKFIQSEL